MNVLRDQLRWVGVLILISAAGAPRARATTFSNASLKGSYSFLVDRWTANVSTDQYGMEGVLTFDGVSSVSGSYTSMSANTVQTGTLGGTYSVASNGTGSITFTSGSTDQFAMTLYSTSTGIARTVELLQTNDTSNEIISGTAALQSTASVKYGLANLKGTFAFQLNTWTDETSQAEDADMGVFTFDGKGHVSGAVTVVFDGGASSSTFSGTYTVNSNGTGTLTIVSKNSPQYALALNSVTAGVAGGLQILATNPGNGSGNYIIAGAAAKQ